MSLQTIQAAQIRAGAARITSGSLQARREIDRPGAQSYPFGARWNVGIGFSGDAMRVYSGVCYHAGKKLAWAGPGTGNPATVTGLTDGAVVCVVYTLATRVVSIAVRDPAEDYGGEIVRALCSVKVANNIASLDKWYGGGFELGIKGGSV